MNGTFLRSGLVLSILAGAIGLAACQGTDHPPGEGGDFTNPGGTPDEKCTDGTERACGIPVRAHDGVEDCIEAKQICHGTTWGECGEIGPVTTMSVKLTDPGLLSAEGNLSTKNFGSVGSCTTNPCDPYCQTFPDTPPGTLDAGVEPDGFTYGPDGGITLQTTGSGVSIDGGAPSDAALGSDPVGSGANYNGTCTSNAQCNLDQHCVAGTCTSWGSGEFDNSCSAPGDTFGAVQPKVLCNYVDSNDHFGEFQGSATVGLFTKTAGADAAVVAIAGYSDYLANSGSKTGHNRLDGKIKIFDAKLCKTLVSIPSADNTTPLDVEGAAVPEQVALGEGNILRFNEQSTPLLVDLDADGIPEVVAEGSYYYDGNSTYLRLFAFKITVDGSGNYTASYFSKWKDSKGIVGRAWMTSLNDVGNSCNKNSDCTGGSLPSLPICDTTNGWCSSYAALIPLGYWDSSGPSTLDLDNDGTPEIVWNGYVFNSSGQYVGYRPDPNGLGATGVETDWGTNSIIGDFDLDGKVETMERQGLFEAGSFGYSGTSLNSMAWSTDTGFTFPTYKGCSSGYNYFSGADKCEKCSRAYSTYNAGAGTCDGCPDSTYTHVTSGALNAACAKCSSGSATLLAGAGVVNDGKCATCANAYQAYNAGAGTCDGCNTGFTSVTSGALKGFCAKCSSGSISVGGVNDGRCTACTNAYQAFNAGTGTCDGCDATNGYTKTTVGSLANQCTKCASGALVSGAGVANDGKCEACVTNEVYNGVTGACDCSAAAGFQKVTAGSLANKCVKCPAAQPNVATAGSNNGKCVGCGAGTWNAATNACVGGTTTTATATTTSTYTAVTLTTPATAVYSATPISPTTAAFSIAPSLATPTSQPYALTTSTSPTGVTAAASATVTLPSNKPSAASHDPFIAFADFGAYGGSSAQGKPEMVWVSEGYVYVMAIDGTPVLGFPSTFTASNKNYAYQGTLPTGEIDSQIPMPPKNDSSSGGGSVTIGDYDGDGLPEFGIAGGSYYVVFDLDCISPRSYGGKTGKCDRTNAVCDCGTCGTATENNPILWCRGTQDQSSFITGSSVFDFNADGNAEVVYADECWLRVYDGRTGAVYFSAPHSSQTKLEEPVVADVNGDGRADLLMTSTRAGESSPGAGLACPSACASGEQFYAATNSCYNCGNASEVGSGPYTCSNGAAPFVYGLVTEDVYFGGTKQNNYSVDRNFPGLPCQTATDCPSTGMTCSAGLCRCTTATYSPASDPQCGAGFTCVDPHAGTAGSGKVCRAIRCTGNGCGVSGVQVYTGPSQGWAKSRPIWNEHAYTPTDINDDGSVKKTSTLTTDETAAWSPSAPRSNSFRQQLQTPGTAAINTPSLTLEYPCDVNSIPVCNRGSGQAAAGQIVVGFASTGTTFSGSTDRTIAVGPCTTTVPIDPGQCINLTCPGIGKGPLEYVVNPSCVGNACKVNSDCSGASTCDPTSHHCLDNTCTNTWTPATQCTPASGQWAYTAGGAPNPTYCGGGTTASAATFTRTYVANNCPTGSHVKWGLFSYSTNDPTGTNVTFNFSTGTNTTETGPVTYGTSVLVAKAGYTTGTSTAANPQTCLLPSDGVTGFSCPIDVGAKLLAAGQRSDQPYLQLNATLNPYVSGGVAATPTLNSWNVTYDCIPSE